ncbi:MAG: hypothetical protein MH208_09365 [Marinobacter sp.]|nr:hypothetical protein [Marinobacter sp.]
MEEFLKALGFSYDRNNTIYSNVFGNPHQPKSATINYKVNGNPDTFTWNGENRDQELENISVFNSDCVQISLDASRQLIVSPIGFHLFNLVSAELGELDSLLKAKKSEHPTQLSWIENLHEGTHQHQFIDSLSKDRNEKCLNELSDFTLEHEKDLERKETEISKLNKSLLQNEVEVRLQLNYESFGLDDQDKPLQPQKLQDYNQFLTDLKKTFVEDKVAEDSVFQLNYVDYIQFFTEKKSEIDKIVIEKSKLLGNLDKNEKELKAKIAELKDRKLLSSKKEEVKKAISNHKILSVLNSHSNSFNTSSISRKTSQAREELVSQNFNHIFQDELKALRKSSLQIELSFGTDRGRSKLSHRIGNKQLLEILSEGEQKAIALSEFLTELQLDNVKAPVIFDDPVNSLDHKIIDAVAKRMVRLSKDRQVVIFTHSVLLFNSLLYLSTQPNF